MERMQEKLGDKAQQLMQQFKREWEPQTEKLRETSELLRAVGGSGFDLQPGMWSQHATGLAMLVHQDPYG